MLCDVSAADGSNAVHHWHSVELSDVQERFRAARWCLACRPRLQPCNESLAFFLLLLQLLLIAAAAVFVLTILGFRFTSFFCVSVKVKLSVSLLRRLNLSRCQTNDKIGRFYLPTKSPHKNLSCVMQKSQDFIGRQNSPILSAKIEHVLSSTILSGN